MISATAARWTERIWHGHSELARALQPLAWAFGAVVWLRRRAYRSGWLAATRIAVPVVIVGSVTVGGTGKTPVVDWLVRRLQADGLRPGIASRGYGGQRQRSPVFVGPQSAAADVGDEPVLLSRRTGVPVCVCVDRVRAAQALAAAGAGVVVADDGLQHYRLARDFEIAVVDGRRGLGNRRLIPAGPLREPADRLRQVDVVLINGAGADLPGVRFSLAGGTAVGLAGGELRPLGAFAGQQVWAVAGIGNPQRFYDELSACGIEPVAVPVADHGRVDLAVLSRKCDRPILMTEKDAVKYSAGGSSKAWYVPVQLSLPEDAGAYIASRVRALTGLKVTAGVHRG